MQKYDIISIVKRYIYVQKIKYKGENACQK